MLKLQEKQNKENEDYLVKCIGHFGIWQGIVCLMVSTVRLSAFWNTISIFFLTPRTTFICKQLIENSSITEVQVSKCYEDCLEYQYDNDIFDETLISQFGLVCERAWLASFAQSSTMFGLLIGTNLFGWVADRFGRRTGLFTTILLNTTSLLSASYASDYWVFTVLRIFAGISTGGIYVISTVIVIEISGPKHRSIVGCLMLVIDNLGQVSLVLFAYMTNTWSQMIFATAVASAIFLLFFFLLPEVPRWLVFSGRTDQAIDVLKKAAKWNRKSSLNIPAYVKQMKHDLNSASSNMDKTYNCTALFNTRKFCVRSTALCVIWWSVGVSTYGLNQYTSFIGDNIYMTVMITGFATMVSPVIAAILTRMFGRKISLAGSLAFGTVLMIALTFASKDHWSSTALAITGNSFFAVSMTTIYVFTPELYPTPIRNMGLGLASSGSKLGAMLAPFVATLEPGWIASVIFSVLPVVAIIVCNVLPETKDRPLEDTLEE